ncbi:MAG: NifB/NifX family molybdenum-iron cluster-binding protein [Desulfobacterales bacterium]
MKVALAVWNGRISPVFDVSRDLMVIDIDGGREIDRIYVHFSSDQPMHKVRRLVDMEVEVLLCGAVSRQLAETLEANGIRLFGFISGEAESVISAYLKGRLPSAEMSMPGCRPARRRRREKFRGKKGRI